MITISSPFPEQALDVFLTKHSFDGWMQTLLAQLAKGQMDE